MIHMKIVIAVDVGACVEWVEEVVDPGIQIVQVYYFLNKMVPKKYILLVSK